MRKPVSSRQISRAPRRWSFFYAGPVHLHPLPNARIIPLLGDGLRTLWAQAARAQHAPNMIGVVRHAQAVLDKVDNAPARPQARSIPGGFGPLQDPADELLALTRGQPGGAARHGASPQSPASALSIRALPSADRPAIDAELVGYGMHRDVALEQLDGAEPPPLQIRRTPLWAHGIPPTKDNRTLLTQ